MKISNTDEDKFINEFNKLYSMTIDIYNRDIEFINKRIDIWNNILKTHYSHKPFKIFKKEYQEWQDKLNEINNIIHKIYIEYEILMEDKLELLNKN